MPDFKGAENLYLILAFIVPGLVVVYVRSRFITGRSPSHTDNVLSYLTLSLFYYALVLPFIEPALSVKGPWIARAVIWICLTLIGPSVLGLFLGATAQKGLGNWAADKLGLRTIHVIPAAWDWRFSTMPRGGMFLMVTLTNDARIAGYFGVRSFASSDSGERDLYLEEEYTVSDDGSWQSRSETVGILIPGKEIRHVEFWEPQMKERANG
ncbi:MAG: DUF6338 family protein [Methylocella sp.]